MHGSAQRRIWIRRDFDAPIVGTDYRDFFVRKKLRGCDADSGTGLDVFRIVFHPQRSPTGVNQHHVTRANLQFLALERAAQVGGRNLVTRLELRDTFIACDIEEYSSSEYRPDVFDAELCQSFRLSKVGSVITVVKKIADSKMPEAIELCS